MLLLHLLRRDPERNGSHVYNLVRLHAGQVEVQACRGRSFDVVVIVVIVVINRPIGLVSHAEIDKLMVKRTDLAPWSRP